MKRLSLRQETEDHNLRWQRFHEWEQTEAAAERDPARLIADLGFLLSWIPKEEILRDPDPEKTGVRSMFAALGRLRSSP